MKASFQRSHLIIIWFLLFYLFAQIAQLVEHRTENPRVTGSIPVLGTKKVPKNVFGTFSFSFYIIIFIDQALNLLFS